jgi:ketosteroid isomerase-like protein
MDAYARGDMPEVLALLDDDVELYSPPELGNSPAAVRGHDGYLRWLNAWLEAWEDYEVEVERIEPVGERHVVADCRQRATGRESGVAVEFVVAYMWEVAAGRATAFHLYRTWDEAVAAAMQREADAGGDVA